ncbi:hypothetical protein [Chryseolinea soli]|uniref:Outer membrane protein beta-barrel domain-containing protein n=1 Tax=Chryseolinea soli TaxID=2321403 RepID=A0A385SCV9_9BACT|nr:hypothetical protein [Chryseolinea soli]AYB29483.1 hypothetical protein D4L85_02295 [Chryseolinea soli]
MKINVTFQLLLYSCFIAIAGYGQTDKGSFLLGGSIGFTRNANTTYGTSNSNIISESKWFSIAAQPSVSYFIIDRLTVGLITPYSYAKTNSKSNLSTEMISTTKTYSVGPTVRYYFLLGSQWAIFPEVSYSYGWTWDKYPNIISQNPYSVVYTKSTEKMSSFQGGVGLVYFLTQSVGIEGRAFYQTQHTRYEEESYGIKSIDEPSFNFGLGVQIYFAKNKK